MKGKDPGPTTPFNIIQSYSIPSTWKGTMSFKIEDKRDKWMEHSYGRVSGQLLLWHFWTPKKSPKQPIKNSNKINTSTIFGNFQYIVFVVFLNEVSSWFHVSLFFGLKRSKSWVMAVMASSFRAILNRWFPLRPAPKPRSSWWFMWFHPYFAIFTLISWGNDPPFDFSTCFLQKGLVKNHQLPLGPEQPMNKWRF